MKNKKLGNNQVETTGQTQQGVFTQPPLPEVYSNVIRSNFNPYEFELTFGLVSSNYQGIRPVINARISPQLAKEFAGNLAESVRLYEEQIGEIRLPDSSGSGH